MSIIPTRSVRRTRRRAVALAAAFGIVAPLLLSACGSSGSPGTTGSATTTGAAGTTASAAPASGVLKWAVAPLPATWDPIVLGSAAGFTRLALVYSSLTSINASGEAIPALAESWAYNSDGTVVTFHLRPGLKFTDGEPVNAQAVIATIQRAKNQKDSSLVESYAPIKDAQARGDLDIELHLDRPNYQMPLVLGERAGLIASPKAAADPTKLSQAPVGAGPFYVENLVPGQQVILKKNPGYWDADNIHIAEVQLLQAPDPATLVAGLQSGAYNFAALPAPQYEAAKAAGLNVFSIPSLSTAANISININKAPFKDNPDLVTAFRYAINRQQFVDQLTFGLAKPAFQLFPEGIKGHDPALDTQYPYDVDKAKEFLAKAGYKPGELSIDLIGNPATSQAGPNLEIIQSQLKAIGVNLNIKMDPNWTVAFLGKQYALSVYATTGRDSYTQLLRDHFGADGTLNLSTPYVPDGFLDAIAKAEATPLDSPDFEKNLIAASRAGHASQALIFTVFNTNLWVKDASVSDLVDVGPYRVNLAGVRIKAK